MLPFSLLSTAQGHPMLVELKSGETYNGHLIACDVYMNLSLKEVIQTSPDGSRYFSLTECYIRGNNIKYIRVADDILDLVKENQAMHQSRAARGGSQRGYRGTRVVRGGTRGNRGRGS